MSREKDKFIVATLGAKGSIAYYKNKTYYQKAIEVEKIVDTTGCGDSFQAAFSIEWLKTKDVNQALKAGSIAASKTLGFHGGVDNVD